MRRFESSRPSHVIFPHQNPRTPACETGACGAGRCITGAEIGARREASHAERGRTLSPPRNPRLAHPPRPRRRRLCLRRRGRGRAGWLRSRPSRTPLARGPSSAGGRPLAAAARGDRCRPARPQPRRNQPAGHQRHPQRMRPGEPVPIEPGDAQHRARIQDQGGEEDHECQGRNDASHGPPGWPCRHAPRKSRCAPNRPTRPRPADTACCARPPAPSPGCRAAADHQPPAARCPASTPRARPSARW